MGLKAYPSIEQVPEPVDLALICTPAKTLPGILELSGRNGVKGAVILASGFGEAGEAGARLEQETLTAARRSGVRIIGPNTSGLFNLHKKVNLLALEHPIEWFEKNVITAVPPPYAGSGRNVYPGFIQLTNFISMNLDKHRESMNQLEMPSALRSVVTRQNSRRAPRSRRSVMLSRAWRSDAAR